MKITKKFTNEILNSVKPPPVIKVSDWANKHLYLSSEDSSEVGLYSTNTTPFHVGILDSLNEKGINTTIIMSSAQIGKTTILKAIIGYYIDQDPSPILMMQPTEAMGEAFSRDRFAPMVRDSPILAAKVANPKARYSGNTVFHKNFIGGHLTIVGSNSPAALSSRPIRILLCDEVDRYPPSAGSEGDPVLLAMKRTTTFWNKKIILTSTPTIKNASRIEDFYLESDQRNFFVKCPNCFNRILLDFNNLSFEQNNPSHAKYICPECKSVIDEKFKSKMCSKGEWISTFKTSQKNIAGFTINELYSPWKTWGEIASDYIIAKKEEETLRVFVNTSLGKSWEQTYEDHISYNEILKRCESYSKESLPKGILILTAGVDVQDDRLEIEVVGWAADVNGDPEESWGIEYLTFNGSPSKKSVWDKLDVVLQKTYLLEDGRKLRISATCIDTGGHHAAIVYQFCNYRLSLNIFAVKGASGNRPIWPKRATVSKKYNSLVHVIGVDTAKEALHARLKIQERGAGYIHLPDYYTEEWAKQFVAEKMIIKYRLGKIIKIWNKGKHSDRTEALDCRVYAMAALNSIPVNWSKIKNYSFNNSTQQRKTTPRFSTVL